MSATVHCGVNSLRRPLNCILSATKEKQQFPSSYAVASPQGAAVGGRHKQARDSRVDRQYIHDEVGQQLVHTDKRFRLARPGRSTHSGRFRNSRQRLPHPECSHPRLKEDRSSYKWRTWWGQKTRPGSQWPTGRPCSHTETWSTEDRSFVSIALFN